MKRRAGMLVSAAAAAIVAASTFALLQNSNGSSSDDPTIRGCRERVEGGKIVPNRTVDTVIGQMALISLPVIYRDYASRPDSELKPYPGVGMPMMKSIGVLRAGARVTLVVPRRQRRWMKVVYDLPRFKGGSAITLQACRSLTSRRARRRECGWRPDLACRWRYTQFNGGLGLDLANAPRRGLCAELIVRADRKTAPLREFLFDPEPGACSGEKPAATGSAPLPRTPTAITNACTEADTHVAFPVLCPARWPSPSGRGAPKARLFERASVSAFRTLASQR
jgi:hypothetical protein